MEISSWVRKFRSHTWDLLGLEVEGQEVDEKNCHILEGFSQEYKILLGDLPLLL